MPTSPASPTSVEDTAAREQAMPVGQTPPVLAGHRHRLRNALAVVCGALLVMGVLVGIVSLLSPGGAGPQVAGDSSIMPNPNPVAFGDQTRGTASGIKTVVVSDHDTARAVSIGSVEISGSDASDFVMNTNTCKAVTLSPGQRCSVDVRFTPKATGTRRADLLVHRGDVARSVTVTMTGVGVAQPLTVHQPTVDFGPIAVRATSVAETITATNTSSQPLVMQGVALMGDQPQDFSINAAPAGCAGITLRPGGNCVVSVTFTPTDVGTRTASVAYRYAGAGSPLFAGLAGVGATLSLTVVPDHLDFGKQQVGVAGKPVVVTISTPAGTTTGIRSLAITGPDAAYFKINSDGCTGKTLASAASCRLTIQFIPGAIGVRLAALAIVRAHEASIFEAVQLHGFGFVPRPPRVVIHRGNRGD